jgi:16S rRNA (adenine1518-N6/adenine1519-N6)-dimethyltransferase
VVGNLPYNISTPLIFHLLAQADAVTDMVFMLQREVVDRMVAAPGGKTYGRLSVMVQAACTATPLFRVPPGAFYPVPKVASAVVHLRPLAGDPSQPPLPTRFPSVVEQAFRQRRKTLRNALRGLCDADCLAAAGIDPGARAESLAVADFRRIAEQAEQES